MRLLPEPSLEKFSEGSRCDPLEGDPALVPALAPVPEIDGCVPDLEADALPGCDELAPVRILLKTSLEPLLRGLEDAEDEPCSLALLDAGKGGR